MNHSITLALLGACFAINAPASASAQSVDIPQTRLVPIGSPSAVDQYRNSADVRLSRATSLYRETAYQRPSQVQQANAGSNYDANSFDSPVRQTVMQQFEVPQLPNNGQSPGNFAPPPSSFPPSLPPSGPITSGPITSGPITSGPITSNPAPPRPAPGLPMNPQSFGSNPVTLTPVPGSSDLAPLAQPQLGSSFATIDNCNCISAASSYSAASSFGAGGCSPVNYQTPPTYIAPPTQIPAPAILPGGFSPPPTSAAPAGALLTFGQEAYPVQVGQGLFGQPKAYVPGQNIRNWLRYLTP